jgi:Uncharacterised nucleotidyltransferase
VSSASSPLESAWRAIAHFLGEPVSLPAPLDPGLIGELARIHRLEGALAEPRLTPISPEPHLPSAIWTRWRQAHAAGIAQAVRRSAPLQEALLALAPAPVIVLKGAALAELIYPSPGARSMGDVDLLIPEEALAASLGKLEALGYRRKYPDHPILDHESFHERQLEGPLELDLHQAFVQPTRLRIDYPAIFARAIAWPALAPNARLLAPEDAVVYGCLHAAIGEFTPTWAPAIGLLDLRELLDRPGPFWGTLGPSLASELVRVRAGEWGADRMLHVALALAGGLFPSLRARPTWKTVQPPLSPLVRSLLDVALVARASPPPLSDPFRAEAILRKGLLLWPRDRLRFAAHALLRRLRH